ncbi:hypothetical protein P8452_14424 [Trifolium repens]|nr:hypothetical protein P8452_14424 [Trifolium repens]
MHILSSFNLKVEEIDAKLCESAAASLEGKILASFTKIIVYLSYEKQLIFTLRSQPQPTQQIKNNNPPVASALTRKKKEEIKEQKKKDEGTSTELMSDEEAVIGEEEE